MPSRRRTARPVRPGATPTATVTHGFEHDVSNDDVLVVAARWM